jgi:hypothetical protein
MTRINRGSVRKIVVIEERTPAPALLERLRVVCPKGPGHELANLMEHIGWDTTQSGGKAAVYACRLCNRREGWALDYQTGKPRRVFVKPATGTG